MNDAPNNAFRRTIRSFVRREGRLTPGQQKALDTHWPAFGIDISSETGVIDWAECFQNDHPVILEIGFGNGESLATQAEASPDQNYVGIEVHRPGVGMLLRTIGEEDLTNVRVLCHDAVEVLKHHIADASLSGLQLFFPDPWHKKKHHKRRIVQPEWVELVGRKLVNGGFVHMATDWEDYAVHMLDVLERSSLRNRAGTGQYAERPDTRPITKFERRGERLGHGSWDLLFEKVV